MSYLRSIECLVSKLNININPISKTSFIFIILIGEEGANPYSDRAEYREEEDLDFVARMSEMDIIIGPEDFVKLKTFMLPRHILRFLQFYNKFFFNQRVPSPLEDLLCIALVCHLRHKYCQ